VADHLVVDDSDRHAFRLSWYLEAEDDIGGCLGQDPSDFRADALAKAIKHYREEPDAEDARGSLEHVAASTAAAATKGANHDRIGLYWETHTAAARALKIAKAAIQAAVSEAENGKAWPAWAIQAKAAGWKPPKGWKP